MIGIGLIFHYYMGLPTGLGVILSSIPLYIYAWYFEKNYFWTACMACFFPLYASIFFRCRYRMESSHLCKCDNWGGLIGLGIGLMLRYGTSTGGTDMLAQIISRKSGLNVGLLIFDWRMRTAVRTERCRDFNLFIFIFNDHRGGHADFSHRDANYLILNYV